MRVSGNTPYIRTPRKQKKSSRRTLIIMLITIALPPLGLILLWRVARCPLRGKVLISALGAAVMVLAFALYIGNMTPSGVDVPVEYQFLSSTPTPSETVNPDVVAPPPGETAPDIADDDMLTIDIESAPDDTPSDVIPANPADG